MNRSLPDPAPPSPGSWLCSLKQLRCSRRWIPAGCLLLWIPGTLLAGSAAHIDYTLSLAEREQSRVQVRMLVQGIRDEEFELALPVWNNTYQVRDFARFIEQIDATAQGKPVPLWRSGKSTWRVKSGGQPEVEIRYWVRAELPGSFSTEVTSDHAFVHAALICLFLPDHRSIPHLIRFRDYPSSWKVATGLDLVDGAYRAEDYDHLIDSPFELSSFDLATFQYEGVDYQVVVDGRGDSFAMADLVAMLEKIVRTEMGLMGQAPFRRYVFIYHVDERGSGGMEHRNSTAIGLRRAGVRGDIVSAAGVSAHEFFHLWNVKRIRPAEFDRMNWLQETPTRALWLSEGGTSYYSLLTRIRAGLIQEEEFYQELGDQIRTLQSRPARLRQSVEQSSLETWYDRYPDYRLPENSISYYNKGMLVAFLLDLEIRHRTSNQRSLDDVMRWLNVWFGERGVGFQPGDIRRAVESIAQSSFEDFFRRYVAGVDELPYQQFLTYAGLELSTESSRKLDAGFRLTRNFDETPVVARVVAGSPAAQAGLLLNDRLLRLNGQPVGQGDPIEGVGPDQLLELTVLRGRTEVRLQFHPQFRVEEAYSLHPLADPTPLAVQIRESLMKGR